MDDKNLARNLCWYCKSETGFKHFCDHCVKIQPLVHDVDYFRFMGLERKLNIDIIELDRRYYELSKKFHPDYYQSKTDFERLVSRDRISLLNEAYTTLKDPIQRAEYIMRMEGVNIEKGTQPIPPDFVNEVFELQEKIEQFEKSKNSPAEKNKALKNDLIDAENCLNQKLNTLLKDLSKLFVLWDGIFAGASHEAPELKEKKMELIHRMKEFIDEKSYLETVRHKLMEVLA